MAFIREYLTEETEKQFASYKLNNPVTLDPLQIFRWYIDRERNLIFFGLGGQGILGGDIPAYYALIWNDNIIVIETFSKAKLINQVTEEEHWYIVDIKAPVCLKGQEERIVELVKQSIDETQQISISGVKKIIIFEQISIPNFYEGNGFRWQIM